MQRQGSSSGPFPPTSQVKLLRVGERVQVTLRASDRSLPAAFVGAIAGTDEYGILIERESGGDVFIPWQNISTITKLTTG